MTVPMRRRGSAFRKRSPATGDGEGAANRRIVARLSEYRSVCWV